ncbi:MAG: FAD:protein FMN transferase [Lentisphaeria bacterium]|jgi:thiamine biosynthesis lipoprotein|nr:FAD:protein FMN transferase [Lentisphaeria bacterium]MDY0175357.1 FAD:protein FMN transferase [Lentisphaeria bacterium]NLZ60859.1 FAD:protein FMN transferase [Lentisphaerota bacterium]
MRNVPTVIFSLLLILSLPLALRRGGPAGRQFRFFVFNTLCEIQVWDDDPLKVGGVVSAAMSELQELHDKLNIFAADSELSQLNRSVPGEYFACSKSLWQCLLAAQEAYELSEGAFDVTVAPLMRLWSFGKEHAERLPSADELQACLAAVGFDKVSLDHKSRSVALTMPGMALDMGGLAKGYALDRIKSRMEGAGLNCYMLNFGGNIYCSEKPPPGKKYFSIGIRSPEKSAELAQTLHLRDRFVSTSANYERGISLGEKKIGHLLDPKSGYPVATEGSVTVICSKGIYSDIFSTAVFVGGRELADKLSREVENTEFVWLP